MRGDGGNGEVRAPARVPLVEGSCLSSLRVEVMKQTDDCRRSEYHHARRPRSIA